MAIGAGTLWCQFGVINAEGAKIAEEGGLTVIMDRCIKVEHARYVGRMHWLGFNTQRVTSVPRRAAVAGAVSLHGHATPGLAEASSKQDDLSMKDVTEMARTRTRKLATISAAALTAAAIAVAGCTEAASAAPVALAKPAATTATSRRGADHPGSGPRRYAPPARNLAPGCRGADV